MVYTPYCAAVYIHLNFFWANGGGGVGRINVVCVEDVGTEATKGVCIFPSELVAECL